jgi:hypothetical protein
LKWDAVVGASSYEVQYRIAGGFFDWTTISASTNHTQINDLFPETDYEWRVRSVCNEKLVSPWSVTQSFTTPFGLHATQSSLAVNRNALRVYPNPISQFATISFSLGATSRVSISLNDLHGRTLKVIADENFSTGYHEKRFDRGALPAGIYFLRVKINDQVMMSKIVVE